MTAAGALTVRELEVLCGFTRSKRSTVPSMTISFVAAVSASPVGRSPGPAVARPRCDLSRTGMYVPENEFDAV